MSDNISNQDIISVKGNEGEIQLSDGSGDLKSVSNVYVTNKGILNATAFTGDGGLLSNIAAPSPSVSIPNAVITETQTTGTSSPISFTASAGGTKLPRQFNVVVNNGLAITLGGTPNWTFTIPTAGTYLFDAIAFYSIGTADGTTTYGKLFLNNQSLGLGSAIVGMSSRFGTRNSGIFLGINNACFLNGILTLAGVTVFSLDHIVANSFQANTGGYPSSLAGAIEIYATIKIIKLA